MRQIFSVIQDFFRYLQVLFLNKNNATFTNPKQPIHNTKNAFLKALQQQPGFLDSGATDKGKIVDKKFKFIFTDVVEQLGYIANQDYESNLRSNEPGADFVVRNKEANDKLKSLISGEKKVIKEHTRISSSGKISTIKPHLRRSRTAPAKNVSDRCISEDIVI
ncbi:hypothetical protein [Chamaesiphon sp.]|uniref:hypothetical protein n=1 Tax=Chamaesiphon sp. TaxID=2814140 RepID=UPI0035931C6F